jgi:hypothetical protein
VPLAQAALASRFPTVRQAAVYALEVMEHPAARAALIAAIRHADANVRYRAAIVLGRRQGSATASEALRQVAQADPEPHVRQAAQIAAAFAGGGDVAGVLVDREKILAEAAKLPARKFEVAAGKPTVIKDGLVQVESQKQLLVDDLVLDDLGGASRTLHKFRKDPRNPVLEQQFPWELMGTLSYCTTVRYDPETRLFSFWYTSLGRVAKAGEAIASRAQCLAYSTDGIHWVRPKIGLYEFQGSQANNLVGRASNILYLPDQQDAGRRFASYIYYPKFHALAVSYSPDGLGRWTDRAQVCGGGADVDTVCRDFLVGGYFAFMKWRVGRWNRRAAWAAWGATPDSMKRGLINATAGLADDRGSAERLAAAFPGLDFFKPEVFRTEVYEVVPFIYEGVYFGFPIRFDVSGPGAGNVDGQTDLTAIFSRDRNGAGGWLRPGTADVLRVATGDAESESVEPLAAPLAGVLDHGRWGEWDATQHYGPSSVLVLDDKIVLYYCGGSFGHEAEGSRSDAGGKNVYRKAIGRATLRLDGMVSLQAGKQETAILTKPLVFRGRELVVNVDCAAGQLRVELLDKDGHPLPGLTAEQSDVFRGDSVRHVITWAGRGDVAALAGQPIRVKFFLTNGHLYSFQFRDGSR